VFVTGFRSVDEVEMAVKVGEEFKGLILISIIAETAVSANRVPTI
jgi:hypothetical protein